MRLIDGFIVTVRLATMSLMFAIVIGYLLSLLMTSDNKSLTLFCKRFIKTMYGMPLIVFIPFVYYSIQVRSAAAISVMILVAVGAGDLALRTSRFIEAQGIEANWIDVIKVILIKSINEWSRLISITALFSVMGIAEFSRVAKAEMNRTGNIGVLGAVLAVYLLIHLITLLMEEALEKRFLEIARLRVKL